MFTYVIGFIFSVHTYVLSNCYVHSTVPASLEITVRSLPSHWEVLTNPKQTVSHEERVDPNRWSGSSEEGGALVGWPGASSQGAPLPSRPGRGHRLGLAAQLLSPPSVAPQSSWEVTFPPLCIGPGITAGRCFPLPPKSFLSWMLAGGKRQGTHTQPNCRPTARTLALEWMTQGWWAISRQWWLWWAEAKLKQPHLDLAVPEIRQWPRSPEKSVSFPLCFILSLTLMIVVHAKIF